MRGRAEHLFCVNFATRGRLVIYCNFQIWNEVVFLLLYKPRARRSLKQRIIQDMKCVLICQYLCLETLSLIHEILRIPFRLWQQPLFIFEQVFGVFVLAQLFSDLMAQS